MNITTTEEVTRTYCDVCGEDITNGNRTGTIDAIDDYVVCMKTNLYMLDSQPNHNALLLSCETLAQLYTKYPTLANHTFAKTFATAKKD